MESPNYLTRKEAAATVGRSLARKPSAFRSMPRPQRRAELLNELQAKWTAEFGNIDHEQLPDRSKNDARGFDGPTPTSCAVDRRSGARWRFRHDGDRIVDGTRRRNCRRFSTPLMPIRTNRLPPQIFRQVLPRCDKDFELINQLADEQQNVRRSAIEALARRAEEKIVFGRGAVAHHRVVDHRKRFGDLAAGVQTDRARSARSRPPNWPPPA